MTAHEKNGDILPFCEIGKIFPAKLFLQVDIVLTLCEILQIIIISDGLVPLPLYQSYEF